MDTIVCPDTPVVISFSLGVFAILVIEEGYNFLQHWFGYRESRAKGRPCKIKREVGPDAVFRDEVVQAWIRARIRIVVKIDALIDILVDCITQRGFEMLFGQSLVCIDAALEKKLVPRHRDPVHIAKPTPDAHTGSVLGVV